MIQPVDKYDLINQLSDYKVSYNSFSNVYSFHINGILVGFIDYSIMYERAELNYIFIREEYRGKKYSEELVKYMLNDLAGKKVCSITLEVNIDNIVAIKLYEKYGFRQIGIRKNYYENKDALLMEKSW